VGVGGGRVEADSSNMGAGSGGRQAESASVSSPASKTDPACFPVRSLLISNHPTQ
jgi:hypothetical protein